MREYLIRLIHCFMLGYSVDFGIIYAIMATQSGESALDKRVGYLACTLFLEKDHELCIMMINTLQKDLKSQNELDQCAALNAICYLRHPEIADNVFDLVIKAATEVPKQAVRKKAVAALYFLYEAYGLSEEHVMSTLRQALNDPDQSVVFAALAVWKNILQTRAIDFIDLLPQFYTIHRYILDTKVHKSFAYHGVLAPWAQLDCLSIYESKQFR
ncbi:AP-4 complex subunit epsilon-1 [Rhizopus microsporus var. microsporus]|uniref:AP-4 complex subunit epsilon-1 n=1 Tax=Rhizopus microsporus var. microsporus TaxID=86635 RepID=A0A1X0RD53_RHIZD|nr:AP-4 complex subunit epsilon-1 [Rhizopus microsporus var. microsporus]